MVNDGLPLVQELHPVPEPQAVFQALSRQPHCLFLDSALRDPTLGRYSFVTADPFAYLELANGATDPFGELQRRLAPWQADTIPGLPPFQGGAAGLFSYDLNRHLERIALPRYDEFQVPALAIGCYDWVVAWDHQRHAAWVISQGLPEQEPPVRRQRAAQRIQQCLQWLDAAPRSAASARHGVWPAADVLAVEQLAPEFPVPGPEGLRSNFAADEFRAMVQRAVDYIYAGDVFQVNVAQRLLYPAREDSVTLYLRLRERNPAPFAAYFDLGQFQVVSASPERFLSVRERRVETRPIKGTRQRTREPLADRSAGDELLHSEKDLAENVMIVDLLRNDLSRVCRPDSVCVTQLCGLEVYQYVQHLVSAVCGELDEGRTPLDLLRAAFPGGSVTGAPKVRAMQIIAELEPTARGPYCGSLGYLGFDGAMDLSILIRTITAGKGWWQLPVGGGIVAPSNPQQEYEETWHKATGLIKALS